MVNEAEKSSLIRSQIGSVQKKSMELDDLYFNVPDEKDPNMWIWSKKFAPVSVRLKK